MAIPNPVDKFLQALFRACTANVIFSNSVDGSRIRNWKTLDEQLDCYWSIAEFPPEAVSNKRKLALGVRVLVIDDVIDRLPAMRVELALGKPTAVTQSSAGSQQWAYRISELMPVAEWGRILKAVDALIGGPKKTNARTGIQLFRLPMGRNTKPERHGYKVHLVELNPEIEIDAAWLRGLQGPTEPASSTNQTPDQLSLEEAAELMDIHPNDDVDYDEYINVGLRLTARCPEAGEIWEKWSAKSAKDGIKFKAADKWETFFPDDTDGWLLEKAAREADPKRFAAWHEKWWEKRRQRFAKEVFNDGVEHPKPEPRKGITASPFKWKDPASFPLRDWVYGKLLIRKFISMTVAPGGVGKSSLVATEALAQVTERNLLGDKPSKPLRVWIWNLEDPLEETERKIQTAALHYGISEADIGDRLFVDSGRQQKLVIARMQGRDGAMIMQPVVDDLVSEIRRRRIDVVVVDPFVSCHAVPENDNTAQDMIVKEWGAVAERGNCAVHLLDHTRKAPSGTEVETESSRGAKAKTDAARVVRVINRMTDAVGKSHGISDPWQYFNTFHDKSNMAPPVNHRPWFHLESVSMGNGGVMDGVGAARMTGESVGVVVQWTPPSASDVVTSENFKKAAKVLGNKPWRMDSRSPNWWGFAVAPVLEIDATKEQGKKQLDALVKAWLNAGVAQEIEAYDEHRKLRQYIKITGGF